MCKQCQQQFEDRHLAYTLILESRLNHPAADTFVLKFCSREHVQEFLTRIRNQRQKYVLTRITPSGEQRFPADYPLELLFQVGSSKIA